MKRSHRSLFHHFLLLIKLLGKRSVNFFYIYIYMYICIYVYLFIYIYIYIYIYRQTFCSYFKRILQWWIPYVSVHSAILIWVWLDVFDNFFSFLYFYLLYFSWLLFCCILEKVISIFKISCLNLNFC